MFRAIILAAAAFALTAPALAQQDAEEIVVTAARYRDAYENFTVPNVALIRRADFAVEDFTITSDTRDAAARRQELRQALQSLTRFSDRNARVSVALVQQDEDESGAARVVNFAVEKAMLSLRATPNRPDTEYVTLAVRTRVVATDDLDAVEGRFAEFSRSIPKPGRIEVALGGLELTLTDPQQYRAQLVTAIAADASRVASALGPGYGARLEGLENPVAWRRAGDLDLRLFVPYRMVILPRETAG